MAKTIEQIRQALRFRYNKKGYILFEEVKRSIGYMKPERFADAVAISLFPSNGVSLTGFEIKTSRQDLLLELKDLSKSEAVKQFCDYWILIVSDYNILNGKMQIPDDWGVWEYYETIGVGGFLVKRKPKQLYPKPPDRYFMASLLNNNNSIFEAKDGKEKIQQESI
jgi:hypothetical protein